MNIDIFTELEQRFESNRQTIHKANHLLSIAEFLISNPKMEYWKENADTFLKNYRDYIKTNKLPISKYLESKDIVEIGCFRTENLHEFLDAMKAKYDDSGNFVTN